MFRRNVGDHLLLPGHVNAFATVLGLPAAGSNAGGIERPRPVLTSSAAITAFLDLIRAWKLPTSRGWRMLTGVGWSAGSLTPDQIARVDCLIVIDSGLRPRAIGEWMITGNPAPLLCGASPVDYLTRTGTRGYVALARQVGRRARM